MGGWVGLCLPFSFFVGVGLVSLLGMGFGAPDPTSEADWSDVFFFFFFREGGGGGCFSPKRLHATP